MVPALSLPADGWHVPPPSVTALCHSYAGYARYASNGNGLNGRTVIAPMRYHASLDAHSVRLSFFIPQRFGFVMISDTTGLCSRLRARLSPHLSAQAPSFLPLRSSVIRHATPCLARAPTQPSSYHDRQIVPCSAYSAEQNSHDFSQRVVRLGEIPLELNRLRLPHASAESSFLSLAPHPALLRCLSDDGYSPKCLRFARHTGAHSLHDTSYGVSTLGGYTDT